MNTILQVIEKRFGQCMKFSAENKDLILAAISNPKMKGDFIEDDANYAFAKHLFVMEYKKHKRTELNSQSLTQEDQQTDDFLLRYSSRRINRSNSLEHEIEAEICAFLTATETDYKILNRYPVIRHIFFKYNTTLSSSAPVERVFSQSMMIFTPRRNRISAENFEQTLLLKHNNRLMNNYKKIELKN